MNNDTISSISVSDAYNNWLKRRNTLLARIPPYSMKTFTDCERILDFALSAYFDWNRKEFTPSERILRGGIYAHYAICEIRRLNACVEDHDVVRNLNAAAAYLKKFDLGGFPVYIDLENHEIHVQSATQLINDMDKFMTAYWEMRDKLKIDKNEK